MRAVHVVRIAPIVSRRRVVALVSSPSTMAVIAIGLIPSVVIRIVATVVIISALIVVVILIHQGRVVAVLSVGFTVVKVVLKLSGLAGLPGLRRHILLGLVSRTRRLIIVRLVIAVSPVLGTPVGIRRLTAVLLILIRVLLIRSLRVVLS